MVESWDIAEETACILDTQHIGYCFTDESALYLQGVLANPPQEATVLVQWDALEELYASLSDFVTISLEKNVHQAHFGVQLHRGLVIVRCEYNTVVVTNPYRIAIVSNGQKLWVMSLYFYLHRSDHASVENIAAIHTYLQRLQLVNGEMSKEAWNENTYESWVNRHGLPREAAAKIAKNPHLRLHPFAHFLGNLRGKRVAHLMGSHGSKAVAMALLGAEVTVVDVSVSNQRYALDVARELQVNIRYVVSDVLHLPDDIWDEDYDVVLLELGVLHYFVDLRPLFRVVAKLLRTGGRLVLHEFHPISTKLIQSSGKNHKTSGNYFDVALEPRLVAHAKYSGSDRQAMVHLRKWTLGEVVTSVAGVGLHVVCLNEEPNHKRSDIGIPKTFTLLAEKR